MIFWIFGCGVHDIQVDETSSYSPPTMVPEPAEVLPVPDSMSNGGAGGGGMNANAGMSGSSGSSLNQGGAGMGGSFAGSAGSSGSAGSMNSCNQAICLTNQQIK
ncbi:hypothetical protein IT408_03655 [Candidatus Uhrbacteria bacterium]|nr:hypothetical protein [Candidatus Uhrbacteria bacterium]